MLAALRVVSLLLVVLPGGVSDTYPDKPLRLIVTSTPGGAVDLLGRLIGAKLGESLGQSVVVDNRPGAGGNIAAAAVAKAAPDGYTLLLCAHSPLTTNLSLYRSTGYDWRDFEPIMVVAEGGAVASVSVASPATSVGTLLALVKQRPGELIAASPGNGTTGHFAITELGAQHEMRLSHVPFRGGPQAVAALAANEVAVAFSDPGAAVPLAQAGRIRVLAATAQRRASAFPEVPTFAEAGLAGFQVMAWIAVVGPRGVPREVVTRLNGELRAFLADEAARRKIVELGLEPVEPTTPQAFATFLEREVARWGERVKRAGLKIE